MLDGAQHVVIIPGYGMAVAQAQHTVRQLADMLEEKGTKVEYAIHPVAGRMPGHMNVLLAEANIEYEKLREMDDINGEMEQVDVAIVVGANDVVNPVARNRSQEPDRRHADHPGPQGEDRDRHQAQPLARFRRHPQPALRRRQLPDVLQRRQEGDPGHHHRGQGGLVAPLPS